MCVVPYAIPNIENDRQEKKPRSGTALNAHSVDNINYNQLKSIKKAGEFKPAP